MGDREPGAKRIEQLDGVRALAITAVFLHHAFGLKLLWAGVDLFFVLSGFLITGILLAAKAKPLREYLGHFYGRRVRRILPPYLVLLALTSLILGVGWMRHWYLYLFLMNFLVALQLPHPKPLEVLWSLAVEEQFYLVWPVAIFFLSESALVWVAAGLVVLAPLLRWYCTPFFWSHWQIYTLLPFRMDLLAAGALLAMLWRRKRPLLDRFGGYGLVVAFFSAAGLVILGKNPGFSTFANNAGANVWIYELCLFAGVGVVVWALNGRYVGLLRWAPVTYAGRISYTIYLVHTLVLDVVRRFVSGLAASALISLVITLSFAAASWRWLERPILLWKLRSRVRMEAEEDERAIAAPQP